MRISAIALQALLGIWLPGLVLAGSFEGVVTMKESSEDAVKTQKTYFKGEKIRIDEGDGDYTVWDVARKEGFHVHASDKTYMVMPWQDLKPGDAKKMFENMTVARTGKSDKVAGYACETYLVKDETGSSDVCIAKGISNAAYYRLLAGGPAAQAAPAWLRELVKDGGFPLKMVNRDETGAVESTEEAAKVEAMRLDDALFTPPAGFKKTDVRR